MRRSSDGLAYFLDVDGTLVDFADSPERVRLAAEQRKALARLQRRSGGAVALVSGRSIADIDRILRGIEIPVAGQHGAERRDARGRYTRVEIGDGTLAGVRDRLAAAVARHPGLLLEDKGISLALHYRRAPRLAGYTHRLVRSLARSLEELYAVQRGKAVVEIKPAGRDKGMAVLAFMRERPFRGRTPVFVGDDRTDEFGFAAVNAMGGCSVKVGPGPTVAAMRLPDVGAVWAWLAHGSALPDGGATRRGAA